MAILVGCGFLCIPAVFFKVCFFCFSGHPPRQECLHVSCAAGHRSTNKKTLKKKSKKKKKYNQCILLCSPFAASLYVVHWLFLAINKINIDYRDGGVASFLIFLYDENLISYFGNKKIRLKFNFNEVFHFFYSWTLWTWPSNNALLNKFRLRSDNFSTFPQLFGVNLGQIFVY